MVDVTVLGAGSTTVTVSLTSANNAAAAQTALIAISKQVSALNLDQFVYPGTGTVPASANFLGGLILTGAGGDAGGLTGEYVSAVSNAIGKTTVVGSTNSKMIVVSGDKTDMTYLNVGANTKVFLGGGNNGAFQGASGAGMTIELDGTVVVGATPGVTGSKTTVHAYDATTTLINDAGSNQFRVEGQAGANIVVAMQGAGTVPATVTGAGGDIKFLALGGTAFINPGSGNATVFGNVGSGTVSVFGGTQTVDKASVDLGAAFTGKLTVVEGHGYFFGGSGGGNLLFTGLEAGSATLQGGGTGDLLVSQGAGNTLLAGAGSETLSGFSVAASVGGSNFFAGGGNATIFGNSGGGNLFGLGGGLSIVDGRNEERIALDKGTGVGNQFFVSTAAGGGHGVSDFISGTDTFLMAFTTTASGQTLDTLKFFKAGDAGSPFTTGSGTRLTLSGGTVVDFFDSEVKSTDLI